MYDHKWWLCWKISVQCGRELNFLHSDITVIILHGQILVLYNWRPYLSITPRTYVDVNSVTGIENVATNQQQFFLFNIVVELQNISYCCPKYERYLDLHVKFPILMSDLNQIWIFLKQILIKIADIKFDGNPSIEIRFGRCGRTDRHDEANRYFLRLNEHA